MINTPIFGFGAPVYYGYYNSGAYSNDNGNTIRNFYAQDISNYFQNPFVSLFKSQVQSYAYNYYGPGRGSSNSHSKTSAPKKDTFKSTAVKTNKSTETSAPAKTKAKTVTTPVETTHKNTQQYEASPVKTDINKTFVDIARKYSYCSEEDGTHHKFCINSTCKEEDPYDQEWCTDFVTYVVKEAYNKSGQKLPNGFGNHDVETLKNWAIRHGMFIKTANKPRKGTYIAQNIKPGDIFIMNENGASHTGFVTKIDPNTGVIYTIEGNRDDQVKEYSYSPDNSDLSGFIRLEP